MDQSACLEPDQIRRYVLGTVDEEQIEQIASHLRACPPCQALADELDSASDDLIKALRSPPPESPYVSEPQCQSASDRLATLYREHPWVLQPRPPHDPSEGELELPQVLGDYVLLEWIGGNLGAVYKAFHVKLGRLVAVKMLPTGLLANDAAVARFQREINAIGRLDHPNIVRAHDARQVGGKLFLVMEYVDGCDLAELVRRHGPLPIAEACELTRQAAVGLQYVCQHGLVHRDIKPANLMLSRDGQVKLLDLGLAHFRVLPPTGDEASSPGLAVGTADYMAPEQAGDSHNVDIRADIYSLGCTLYKLLAGRAPFETPDCESALDKLSAHVKRPAPPVKQLRDDVPDALAAVVDRMLAKNPAERFETPAQLADALQPFTGNSNLQALVATPTTYEAAQQADQRPGPGSSNRWFWELAALAAAVLLLVLGASMALRRFGPIWSRSTPVAVATHSPPSDQQRPKAASLPEQNPTSEEASSSPSTRQSVATATEPTKTTNESAQTPTGAAATAWSQDQPSDAPNAEPAFAAQVQLDHADGAYHGPPAGPDGQGELIHVQVTSNRPGYLYLLNRQADGTLVCLFPNVYQPDNKVEPGRLVTVPDPDGDFELRASPPFGTETLVALVSLKRIEPTRFGVASLTDQQCTVVDREAVERLRAEGKQNPNTWAEAQVELTTRPGPQAPVEESAPSEPPDSAPPPRTQLPKAIRPAGDNATEVPKVAEAPRPAPEVARLWRTSAFHPNQTLAR